MNIQFLSTHANWPVSGRKPRHTYAQGSVYAGWIRYTVGHIVEGKRTSLKKGKVQQVLVDQDSLLTVTIPVDISKIT